MTVAHMSETARDGVGVGDGVVVGLTGATGHIGGVLLRRLLEDPAVGQVRSVARRSLPPSLAAGVPADRLAHTMADLREPSARRALQGVDVLYHLGAQVWQGPSATGLGDMYGANVEGTRNVALARPGALVLASSAAVYGTWPGNPLPLEEAHEPRPNVECPYALHKLMAEQIAGAELPGHVITRLTAVLGPHADARVARAVRGYHAGVPAVRGVAQALQWLDEDDAVEGLLAAGRALVAGSPIAGQVINLAPPDWMDANDVAVLARSRVVQLPRRLLVTGSELGRRLGIWPFGADRAVLIDGPLALSAAKAARLLGWRASKTSAEVLAAALESDWRRSPRNRQL
jgi:nucleoside-diphosphate-sugar epimerase